MGPDLDTLGAWMIAVMGFSYLRTPGASSFLEQWIAASSRRTSRLASRTIREARVPVGSPSRTPEDECAHAATAYGARALAAAGRASPSVFLTDFGSEDYHSPRDDWEAVNYDKLRTTALTALEFVLTLASLDRAPCEAGS